MGVFEVHDQFSTVAHTGLLLGEEGQLRCVLFSINYSRVAAHDAKHEDLSKAADDYIESNEPLPHFLQCVAHCEDIEGNHGDVDRDCNLRTSGALLRPDHALLPAHDPRER